MEAAFFGIGLALGGLIRVLIKQGNRARFAA